MMRIRSSALSTGQITGGGGDTSSFIVPSHCLLIVPILQPASGLGGGVSLRRTLDWEASDICRSLWALRDAPVHGSHPNAHVITPTRSNQNNDTESPLSPPQRSPLC